MATKPTPTRTSWTSPGQRPLEGRVGIVTGASRGIGVEIARHLASKGCNLALNYTSNTSARVAEDFASELAAEYKIKKLAVQADLGLEHGPKHLIEVTKQNFSYSKGKFQLDIIINNAGVASNSILGEVDSKDFETLYNINVRGPLLLMQAALSYLPYDRLGRIINVSSASSSLGLKGQSIYGGTKAALESMTRTWSRELAERCTVNAINPGPVATDMYWHDYEKFLVQIKPFNEVTPLAALRKGVDDEKIYEISGGGRPAYTEEIAGVVGMLCLPEAGWTTGSVICANGGMKFSF